MKINLLACLLICAASFVSAQEVARTDTLPETLSVSKTGNLLALRRCSESDLARYLNTSPQIARQILREQNGNDSIELNPGDSLCIDYGYSLQADALRCIGMYISNRLDSNLDKYLFSRYWLGKGDVQLSGLQFAGLLLCIKQNPEIISPVADTSALCDSIVPRRVTFYNTPYEKAFGSATIYLNSDNRIIRFFDSYDFNPLHWGVRPLKYEVGVRLVSLFSPNMASDFKVCFDTPSETGLLPQEDIPIESDD